MRGMSVEGRAPTGRGRGVVAVLRLEGWGAVGAVVGALRRFSAGLRGSAGFVPAAIWVLLKRDTIQSWSQPCLAPNAPTDETDYERSHKAGQHYWHAANEGNTDVENGGFGPRHVVYRHLDEIEDGDAEGVRQYWHNDAGEEGVELCSEDAEEGACNKEYVEEDPYVFGDCAESHSDSAGNNIKRNYSPPGYTAVGPEG